MADAVHDLEQLAETCLAAARILKAELAKGGHPQPSFDQNGPLSYPEMSKEAQYARMQLRDASKTLNDLAAGPEELILQQRYDASQDFVAHRYLAQYNIAAAVPLNENISYEELASKTGTNIAQLKPALRQLMMTHIFCEPIPGFVAHSAASKVILDRYASGYHGFITINTGNYMPLQIDAIEKWGHGSQEPNETACQLSHNTDKIWYDYFEEDPVSRTRFANLMAYVSSKSVFSAEHLLAYDWASLGESTVVDIAGSRGACSLFIAQGNPLAKCIVQDLPHIVAAAQDPSTAVVPAEYHDRISFQVHDFWTPQPVRGADVYFLRMIMHNYSDKYCVKILRATVDAMKPGSRIVIMDQVMPPVGVVPAVIERAMRTQDLQMMLLQNATEREYGQWTGLMAKVDPRLKITKVIQPPNSVMAIIEVMLVDEPNSHPA